MKIKIMLLFLPLLWGCKEKVLDAIIDNVGMANETVYSYEYDDEEKIASTIIDYTIIGGVKVDSMFSMVTYAYNENDFLIRKVSMSDAGDTLTTTVYERNSLDSIVTELLISYTGDTILWYEYESFPDGMQWVYFRSLTRKIGENDNFESLMQDGYDTSLTVTKYSYEGAVCVLKESFDGGGELISKTVLKYAGGRLSQNVVTAYFEGVELSIRRNVWDYSLSDEFPSMSILNMNNDTVGFSYPEFDAGGGLIRDTHVLDGGGCVNQFIYENGKEVCLMSIDQINGMCYKTFTYYYDNGDVKRELSIDEKIKM